MKRIMVLGAGGMVDHVMAAYLAQKPDYEIIRCERSAFMPETIVQRINDKDLTIRKLENQLSVRS